MAFIALNPPDRAEGQVAAMYQQVEASQGFVPNHVRAFGLRPGIRDGWLALNRSITAYLPLRTYELVTLAAARSVSS